MFHILLCDKAWANIWGNSCLKMIVVPKELSAVRFSSCRAVSSCCVTIEAALHCYTRPSQICPSIICWADCNPTHELLSKLENIGAVRDSGYSGSIASNCWFADYLFSTLGFSYCLFKRFHILRGSFASWTWHRPRSIGIFSRSIAVLASRFTGYHFRDKVVSTWATFSPVGVVVRA